MSLAALRRSSAEERRGEERRGEKKSEKMKREEMQGNWTGILKHGSTQGWTLHMTYIIIPLSPLGLMNVKFRLRLQSVQCSVLCCAHSAASHDTELGLLIRPGCVTGLKVTQHICSWDMVYLIV